MNTRTKFLALCLFEGVRLMAEQDAMAAQQPPPQPTATPVPADAGAAPTGEAVGADGQPLTVDSMVERLNVIRGGKSFSDPEVYGQLTALFKGLVDQDKLTLDRILMDVGKIVVQDQAQAGQQSVVPPAQTAQQPPTGSQPPPATSTPPPVAAV